MPTKKTRKTRGSRSTKSVKDLPTKAKQSQKVKGGSALLQSAFSNTLKSIGEGLASMARKG
jgi:hypothetical protein